MRPQALMLRSLVLAVLLAGVTFAKSTQGDANASTPVPPAQLGPTVVRWKDGTSGSDMVVRNGLKIFTLQKDGLTVMQAETSLDLWLVELVTVTNGTHQRIEVVPSRITLELVEPEHKPFIYQDPDKLAASVRHTSRWAYVFAAMAGMSTQQSNATGTVTMADGSTATVNATTTTHDQAAEDRAIDNINRNRRRNGNIASEIQGEALRDNTVMPGEHVSGSVFFVRPKHFDYNYAVKNFKKGNSGISILRIPVGNYVFEFAFFLWGPEK